ncbi:MAG: HD domain-containing protein [Prevotellaceae bacterium]|jgi:HD superfamily phosphohydrolase|nr:HD domain-containing protein [Prevotellaceae bacterium]
MINKKKIINDPIHGFIDIPGGLIFELLEHHYMQRLRGIKQMGLSYLVYPGACHSRFSHAVGAMYLMRQALLSLQSKGHEITPEEMEAAGCAILLHDVGHGPFSHTLENTIVENIRHEEISLVFMKRLNVRYGGRLTMAIAIFDGSYPKQFLHQLVSSQLDVDRLDYLRRDSFFSGVVEGMIGLERILKMLDVVNNELVVEAKGIYSVEKFLISRRLMYWQVYLHKTVIAADQILLNILRRAKLLITGGVRLAASPALQLFLSNRFSLADFDRPEILDAFAFLDDSDIDCAIKGWCNAGDRVLSELCRMMVARRLFKIEVSARPFDEAYVEEINARVKQHFSNMPEALSCFVTSDRIINKGYDDSTGKILIRYGKSELRDIYDVSDMLSAQAFSGVTKKYFLCYPKEIVNERNNHTN